MTHERDVERLLDAWFSDGPTKTPDRVIDAVADRIARQPQRPAWRLGWRQTPANAYLRPLAVVAAAVLIAVLGFNLAGGFRFGSNIAAPGPTATPSLSPTPSAAPPNPSTGATGFTCSESQPGCAGPLAAGGHTSANLVVPFRFTTPDGWTNTRDIDRTYSLETGSGITTPIQVLAMVAIADQNTACDPIAKAGADNSVQGVVDFLRAHPGLETTDPVPVEVGGYTGQSIDFAVAPTWTELCPDIDDTGAFALLLTDTGAPAERRLGYTASKQVRWDILDVAGKTVIIERAASSYANKFNEAAAAAQPIIDSIVFTPSG